MILSKKILLYFKDFILQLFVILIVFLTPLGNPFEFRGYSAYDYSFYSFQSFVSSLFIMLFYLTAYFFIPIFLNIYIVRVNKFRSEHVDYIPLKLVMLLGVNFLYLSAWMKLYSLYMYRDFLFPLALNLIGYLIYVWFQKKRKKTE